MARTKTRSKSKRKWGSPAQRAAFKKMIAARKGGTVRHRKRRSKARKSTRRKSSARKTTGVMVSIVGPGGKHVSRKRWRKSGYRRNPHRRRRHGGYRRNPAISLRSIPGTLFRGLKDGAAVVGGKAAARFLANVLPFPKDTLVTNLATQAAAGLAVGIAAQYVFGGDVARFALAGALAAPIEAALKPIPVVGPLLGDDYLSMGAYLTGDDTAAVAAGGGVGTYADRGVGVYAY